MILFTYLIFENPQFLANITIKFKVTLVFEVMNVNHPNNGKISQIRGFVKKIYKFLNVGNFEKIITST